MPNTGGFKGILRKHNPDRLILLFTCILMLVGLVVIYSIGAQRANVLNNLFGANYSESHFFVNQLLSVGLSLAAFFAAYKMPFELLKKYSKHILIAAFIACAILAVAGWASWGIAQCTYGACRWLSFGPRGFQPAELLKLGLLLYLAVFLGIRANRGEVSNITNTLMPLAVISAISLIFVVVIQRDLGTGAVIMAMVLGMLFMAGVSKRLLMLVIAISMVLGLVFSVSAPHRRERLVTFMSGDTSNVEDGSTHHIAHAKMAIGIGGLTGVGIGNSVQATGYLPESINDSVFAIMGETFGFIGLVSILALFVVLLLRILNTAHFLHDQTGRILAVGVFAWIASHVIMNVSAMTGLMPLTGITLPLLSYGGTSMLFIAFGLGIVYQLSSYTAHTPMSEEGKKDESISSRRRVGWSRYTSSRSSS